MVMKGVTHTRRLGDLRTSISSHTRSVPPQEGATHLEVYLLDKERHRLETERVMLVKRQRRIEGRLEEIREEVDNLLSKREQEESAPSSTPVSGAGES